MFGIKRRNGGVAVVLSEDEATESLDAFAEIAREVILHRSCSDTVKQSDLLLRFAAAISAPVPPSHAKDLLDG